jgi:HPt (histidine-containing phosphotransfer) domain-containing protein
VDHAVLDRLHRDLDGSDGAWRLFVQNFVNALPGRIERLRVALTTGDLPGSVDAVRSLKTASQMVGAERLADLALLLELDQRHRTRNADAQEVLPRIAVDHLRRIKERAGQTSYALEAHLNRVPVSSEDRVHADA